MLAPIEMIRLAVGPMIERSFGRIVNITSSAAKAPVDILCLSNGARAGLSGFAGGAARQIARHNVTLNNLLPGKFDTGRLRSNNAARAQRSGLPLQEEIRSEEHTSELQSLMRISYAVFCLQKKNKEQT